MKAIVQVDEKGDFPNENFYLAWKGLTHYNYDVERLTYQQIQSTTPELKCPVIAGIDAFMKMMRWSRIDIDNLQLPSYPSELSSFLNREVSVATLQHIKEIVKEGQKVFVKPLDRDRKMFAGGILDSEDDLIAFSNLPDGIELYVSEPIYPTTEYRVYICGCEILDVRKYGHNVWDPIPLNRNVVEISIQSLKNPPAAYCLDFCVTEQGETTLIEATDAWSFGAYGLDSMQYAKMIVLRWEDIIRKSEFLKI